MSVNDSGCSLTQIRGHDLTSQAIHAFLWYLQAEVADMWHADLEEQNGQQQPPFDFRAALRGASEAENDIQQQLPASGNENTRAAPASPGLATLACTSPRYLQARAASPGVYAAGTLAMTTLLQVAQTICKVHKMTSRQTATTFSRAVHSPSLGQLRKAHPLLSRHSGGTCNLQPIPLLQPHQV